VGVVGRFSAAEGEDELRLDLKGVLYTARLLPSVTALLVRVEAGEARVEAVASEYLALRRDAAPPPGADGDWQDGFAFAEDSGASGGSARAKGAGAKRKRASGSGDTLGGGGGESESEDVGKPKAAGKAKKPRAKATKPRAKAGTKAAAKKGVAKPRAKAKPKAAKE